MIKKSSHFCCLQRSVSLVFIAALLSTILFAILITINNRNATSTERLVNATHAITRQAENIRSAIAENGPAFQGFLLSGNAEWLTSLRTTQKQLKQLTDQAIAQTTEPEQQQKLNRINQLVNQKISLQQFAIGAGTKNNIQTDGSGDKRLTHSIQILLTDFMQRQDELLALRTQASSAARNKANVSIIAGAMLLFLFIMGSLLRLNKDIHLRKLAQEEIVSSETKYRRLIEDAGVTLFTCDTNGIFTYVNDRCHQLTGFTKEELTGQSFSTLLLPSWVGQITAIYVQQLRDKVSELTIEFPILDKEASIKWVEQHSVIIYNEYKQPTGYHCVVKDITERKKQEGPLETHFGGQTTKEMRLRAC